jgi:hypothetical protein
VVWREDDEHGAVADLESLGARNTINIAHRSGAHYDAVSTSMTFSGSLSKEATDDELTMKSGAEVLTETTTSKSLGKLKTIFRNSNGWEQDRCERIAEVALEEEADVICILDARMHPAREGHMKGYERRLEKVTGKKWKGKVTNRPEKCKGCNIGGSILFTSHNCADVRRSGVMKYGVMDKVSLSWMGERINIISTYKPYPNKAKGSLLSAVNDGGDLAAFEMEYWNNLKECVGALDVVVGGDLNVKDVVVDEKIDGSGLVRIPFGDNEYTFKSDIGEEHRGKVIDHILTRGYVSTAYVSQNGRFLNDHIPIIAEITITGKSKKEGRMIGNVSTPNIRPGDEGAKRRLLKEMDKIVATGLGDWTHDQLVIWTAIKAKEIAKSRNRKDNPDGWSPPTRLMRLKVKILEWPTGEWCRRRALVTATRCTKRLKGI